MAVQSESPTYHVDFSNASDDVALIASDGVHFRVPSAHLVRTSTFFQGMFDLPPPAKLGTVDNNITLTEDSHVVEILLKLALGLPAPLDRLKTFEDVEIVLEATEKYGMAGPEQVLSYVLRGVLKTSALSTDLLRVYGVATYYEWDDVAQEAFDQLVGMHIDFSNAPALMDGPSLCRLLAARQHRVTNFLQGLRSKAKDALFREENSQTCRTCARDASNSYLKDPWPRFVLTLSLAFSLVPSLDVLTSDQEVIHCVKVLEQVVCPKCMATCYQWSSIRVRLERLVSRS